MPWWALVLTFFIASLSLWLVIEKVRNRWRSVNELYSLYLLHHASSQMYLIASSIKIITKCVATMYQFKSARIISCWDSYTYVFLGCDLQIQLVLKSLSSKCDDRLEDCFIMYWFTSNILCLNKYTYTFSTCVIYQCSCFFCKQIIVNKYLTTSIIEY